MNTKSCNVSNVEIPTSQRISNLSQEVVKMAQEVRDLSKNILTYFKGSKPEKESLGCAAKTVSFYEELEANLNFIRNNLYDIRDNLNEIQ